jgi:hypothetical protein
MHGAPGATRRHGNVSFAPMSMSTLGCDGMGVAVGVAVGFGSGSVVLGVGLAKCGVVVGVTAPGVPVTVGVNAAAGVPVAVLTGVGVGDPEAQMVSPWIISQPCDWSARLMAAFSAATSNPLDPLPPLQAANRTAQPSTSACASMAHILLRTSVRRLVRQSMLSSPRIKTA